MLLHLFASAERTIGIGPAVPWTRSIRIRNCAVYVVEMKALSYGDSKSQTTFRLGSMENIARIDFASCSLSSSESQRDGTRLGAPRHMTKSHVAYSCSRILWALIAALTVFDASPRVRGATCGPFAMLANTDKTRTLCTKMRQGPPVPVPEALCFQSNWLQGQI